jgi:hypothetical protein
MLGRAEDMLDGTGSRKLAEIWGRYPTLPQELEEVL